MLSARNQLDAVIKSVRLGNVMAEVVMEAAGVEIVSAINAEKVSQRSPSH
jgi:molybdopterin-binding protein